MYDKYKINVQKSKKRILFILILKILSARRQPPMVFLWGGGAPLAPLARTIDYINVYVIGKEYNQKFYTLPNSDRQSM